MYLLWNSSISKTCIQLEFSTEILCLLSKYSSFGKTQPVALRASEENTILSPAYMLINSEYLIHYLLVSANILLYQQQEEANAGEIWISPKEVWHKLP